MPESPVTSSAAESPYFEDVAEGLVLPEQEVRVDERQLFFFSAATYNGHRIHYDRRWATEVEGYPDLLVHGPLQAALAAKLVTDWMGPAGRLIRISSRNLRSVHPEEALRFVGRIAGKRVEEGRGLVDLDVTALCKDEAVMPGSATVSLPRRASRAEAGRHGA